MSKLKAISIKNLRSLKDTGFIELRPMTIIVGNNSAGKSTFARTIPLLRQSVEVPKKEPLLWWGRFVDFGSFAESLNKKAIDKLIEIAFQIEIDIPSMGMYSVGVRSRRRVTTVDISLQIKPGPGANMCHLSMLTLKDENDLYVINYSANGAVVSIKINDFIWMPNEEVDHAIRYNSILPQHTFSRKSPGVLSGSEKSETKETYADPLLIELLSFLLINFLHGNTRGESLFSIMEGLNRDSNDSLLNSLQNLTYAPNYLKKKVRDLEKGSPIIVGLRNRMLLHSLPQFISMLNRSISENLSRCLYIEPLRATAERYYRKQALSVQEVDSRGANVPFYLDSMSGQERRDFDEWMRKHLGAAIRASSDGGHISLRVTDINGVEANLADVGFGFSQILPVALQLWVGHKRQAKISAKRNKLPSIIVIEQPELHLHPEYQAKVGDLLLASIEQDDDLSLVVETHSAAIINRIGARICENDELRKKIQILRFEISKDGSTVIEKSYFDEGGVLTNWPYGFFDA